MRSLIFIAIFGITMVSKTNGDSYSGDLTIADSSAHNYNGLTVAGNFVIAGSGPIRVNGEATVEGNLDYRGSGEFHVTGMLTVRGTLTRRGSGSFSADGGVVN